MFSTFLFLAILGMAGVMLYSIMSMPSFPRRYRPYAVIILTVAVLSIYRALQSGGGIPKLLVLGSAMGLLILRSQLIRYSQFRRVNRWASENYVKLISFTEASAVDAPTAWIWTENQEAFRIEIQNRNGERRKGWLVFGSYWGTDPDRVRVKYDESLQEDSEEESLQALPSDLA